jgi:hypothetical protein
MTNREGVARAAAKATEATAPKATEAATAAPGRIAGTPNALPSPALHVSKAAHLAVGALMSASWCAINCKNLLAGLAPAVRPRDVPMPAGCRSNAEDARNCSCAR